jgi:MFS family permease
VSTPELRLATPDREEVQSGLRLGLAANWRQFSLLVLINAFVGGMVGLERAVVPLLARHDFGIASSTAVLSFVLTFGLVKALANLFAGALSDRIGRKRVLVAGWLIGIPAPLLVIAAPSWAWVVAANILLGINQGLCWSTTVIMKIDLVGPRRRGLAMGINEAAGYGAVSLAALAAGYLASAYALRPQPFYLGIAFAVVGLLLSVFAVRETAGHATHEAQVHHGETAATVRPTFRRLFMLVSWRDRNLFAVSQAGMANNLNDGMAWGLLPLFFAAGGLSVVRVGELAALYPGVWAVAQLGTGALSDRVGRKWLIVIGMWLQAAAIAGLLLTQGFGGWAGMMVALGVGTALVYPTLLAAVGDAASPSWRASAVGIYRLWRDGGYVVGAILAGVTADLFGFSGAIIAVAAVTAVSGIIVAVRMQETRRPSGGAAMV